MLPRIAAADNHGAARALAARTYPFAARLHSVQDGPKLSGPSESRADHAAFNSLCGEGRQ